MRETLVGIVAVNVPILRPLCDKSFWAASLFKGGSLSHGRSSKPYALSDRTRREQRTDSEEYIVMENLERGRIEGVEVVVKKTFQVVHEDESEGGWDGGGQMRRTEAEALGRGP